METQQETLVPTPASQWKGKIEVEGIDLPLPSGNVARVKQTTPQAFITSGMIPDPLSNIVRQAIHTKKGLPPAKLQEIADDPDKLKSALEMFDRVLVAQIIEPKVQMPPVCIECGEYDTQSTHGVDTHQFAEGPRDPDVLYADVVDLEDKMFIFQWCLGGTRDLEQFRQELKSSVGSVSNRQDVRGKAKRPPRRS